MERLKRRVDFRAAAGAMRASAAAFVLQARCRADNDAVRVGFTVSRQVGNAIERNRVRRRLREMVRLAGVGTLQAGHDYVLVGRRAALNRSFGEMMQDLVTTVRRIHAVVPAGTGSAAKRPLHEAGSRAGTRSRPPESRRKRRGPSVE